MKKTTSTTMEIPHNWKPTSEAINSLPFPLRRYIERLEAFNDPRMFIRHEAELHSCVAQIPAELWKIRQIMEKLLEERA